MTPTVALSIAGSDSGGGAGIQADLKTFAAWGVHGTTAVTAVTAQHTAAVLSVAVLSPDVVVGQVEAVLADLAPRAVKTGMLAEPGIVAAVGRLAADGRLPNLVVDPVLVSTSGHALMAEGGVEAYRRALVPHAAVVTPNLFEAALLTGRPAASLDSVEAMADVAAELLGLGAGLVVVKGGHGAGGRAPDVVAGPHGTEVLDAVRVDTRNDHGTGCTLSAAICAQLALGAAPLDAVTLAKAYVRRALLGAAGWRLGRGHGPVDHFGWSAPASDRPPGRP